MMDTETQQWSVQRDIDAHSACHQDAIVSSVHFDHDGTRIVTSKYSHDNADSAWKVWDVATGLISTFALDLLPDRPQVR